MVQGFFITFPMCGIFLNNSYEVFNRYILEARQLLILSMLQMIKCQHMTRHYKKQKQAENFNGSICLKIRKKVAENAEYINTCYALPSGNGIFQVQSRDVVYIVDIVGRQCKCRRWDLLGYLAPMTFLAWDMKWYRQNQMSIHATQLRHLLIHIEATFCHAKTYYSGNMFLDRRLDFSVWEKGGKAPMSRKKHATEVQDRRE